jgi:AraC-like DNA-binding protein
MTILTSRNYSPSASLRDIVARHYVFSATLPESFTLVDSLLSETAFIRILAAGEWAGETAPGQWQSGSGALLFGANCRPFRVRVHGPFRVIGIALRPCGWRSLFDEPASDFVERMQPIGTLWGDDLGAALADVVQLQNDKDAIAACESVIEARIDAMGGMRVDHPMRAFERIVRGDCTMMVQDAAREVGLSERQLERRTLASFGHTPKAIMRRSRFLDMAAAMRGLGQPSDEALAALRYFDQSHLSREFHRFIGLSPKVFAHTPTPLLDAGLKLRDMRKSDKAGTARGDAPVAPVHFTRKAS